MVIYTIGYEGMNAKMFMAYLKKNQISFLADVRERPLSRKKGFSKNAMIEMLETDGIKYKNFKSLGTTKPMRDELIETKNYDKFFSTYKKMLSDQTDALQELLELIYGGETIVLLCFEKEAEKCHRSAIATELKKMSDLPIEIKNLKSFL